MCHGVRSVVIASDNIATPMYSSILSIGLLIGVGGGALYSISLGNKEKRTAQQLFTVSMVVVTIVTAVITVLCFFYLKNIAYLFGANEDTLTYVMDYMRVLLIFSLFFVWETTLSVFIR